MWVDMLHKKKRTHKQTKMIKEEKKEERKNEKKIWHTGYVLCAIKYPNV